MTVVYFIAGHADLTPTEFQEQYVARLSYLVRQKSQFIMDAGRVGVMARAWLINAGVFMHDITVYVDAAHRDAATDTDGVNIVGIFPSSMDCWRAIAAQCHCCIEWIRPALAGKVGRYSEHFQFRPIYETRYDPVKLQTWCDSCTHKMSTWCTGVIQTHMITKKETCTWLCDRHCYAPIA